MNKPEGVLWNVNGELLVAHVQGVVPFEHILNGLGLIAAGNLWRNVDRLQLTLAGLVSEGIYLGTTYVPGSEVQLQRGWKRPYSAVCYQDVCWQAEDIAGEITGTTDRATNMRCVRGAEKALRELFARDDMERATRLLIPRLRGNNLTAAAASEIIESAGVRRSSGELRLTDDDREFLRDLRVAV